jgi:hypothetical protein
MLTGLSRPQQILFFMENHKEGIYSTNYISQWICNNFDLRKKNPTKRGMLCQINNEVSSNFTKFTDPKYKTNHKLNFVQHPAENGAFLYSFVENKKLKLPKTKQVEGHNPYATTKILKPTQTSFKFEEQIVEIAKPEEILAIEEIQTPTEETSTMEENSQLFEDIQAADKIHDPIQMIMDIYNKINLHDLNDFNISSIRDNKKITITVSNL